MPDIKPLSDTERNEWRRLLLAAQDDAGHPDFVVSAASIRPGIETDQERMADGLIRLSPMLPNCYILSARTSG